MAGRSLDELLLTVREVFDYVEGMALDCGGAVVLHLDYELVVVRLPRHAYQDYMDMVMSLADRVVECGGRGYYMFFAADPERGTSVVVRAKPLFRYRGSVYVGFRVVGAECPGCRSPELKC